MSAEQFKEPCGGCGETIKAKRCIGCMHEAMSTNTERGKVVEGLLSNGQPLVTLSDYQAVVEERDALRADNVDLLAGADADAYVMRQLNDLLTAANRRIEGMRVALEFVHHWTWYKEGRGSTPAERLDVIKHYPPIAAFNSENNNVE